MGIDIAPLVGVELDYQEYPNAQTYTFKHQINDKFRFRAIGEYGFNESKYGRILHVFTDTILGFDELRTKKKLWRAGIGVERTKRFGICEIYYGLQMHFGVDTKSFSMALEGTYGPDVLENVPSLIGSSISQYFSVYNAYENNIQTQTRTEKKQVGLGVPIGFGIELIKHVRLQVEITPGIHLTRSKQVFEYFNQSRTLEVEHTTINLSYVGFNVFLGWKF